VEVDRDKWAVNHFNSRQQIMKRVFRIFNLFDYTTSVIKMFKARLASQCERAGYNSFKQRF